MRLDEYIKSFPDGEDIYVYDDGVEWYFVADESGDEYTAEVLKFCSYFEVDGNECDFRTLLSKAASDLWEAGLVDFWTIDTVEDTLIDAMGGGFSQEQMEKLNEVLNQYDPR